jgi:hypothetical protein
MEIVKYSRQLCKKINKHEKKISIQIKLFQQNYIIGDKVASDSIKEDWNATHYRELSKIKTFKCYNHDRNLLLLIFIVIFFIHKNALFDFQHKHSVIKYN